MLISRRSILDPCHKSLEEHLHFCDRETFAKESREGVETKELITMVMILAML